MPILFSVQFQNALDEYALLQPAPPDKKLAQYTKNIVQCSKNLEKKVTDATDLSGNKDKIIVAYKAIKKGYEELRGETYAFLKYIDSNRPPGKREEFLASFHKIKNIDLEQAKFTHNFLLQLRSKHQFLPA